MSRDKVKELNKEIQYLENEKRYLTSMIGLHMAEANQIDQQISLLHLSCITIEHKLRDLRAELADTI